MTILEILRRDVARPNLPSWDKEREVVCWPDGVCAMGLHPLASNSAPLYSKNFGYLATDDEVRDFGEWFDGFTDPLLALEAVWPLSLDAGRKTLGEALSLAASVSESVAHA